MASSQYKLIYFDIFGLGEPIRRMFAYAGVPFEDYRIPELPNYISPAPTPEWDVLKSKTPFGTLPVLEVDGKYLGETMAIARYLARPLKLAGKNEWEMAEADSIVTYLQSDYMSLFGLFVKEPDQEQKVLAKEKLVNRIAVVAEKLEKIIQNNAAGKGFIVGESVTFADFFVVMFYDTAGFADVDCLGQYKLLTAHRERVRGLPGVKEFIQKYAHLKM